MKKVFIFIAFLLAVTMAFLAGRVSGYSEARASTPPINVVYNSKEHMYTVYILKNCLQQLQTLKGGEK